MTLIIKIIHPHGIVTAADRREVYSIKTKKSSKRKIIAHSDNIIKSYVKNNVSISISGNAFIDSNQIKDLFPKFLDSLCNNIAPEKIGHKILSLYENSKQIHKTKYFISYYDKISLDSKYKSIFKSEPYLYLIDTELMKIERLNKDEDGFTYGFFWGGENEKINQSLRVKRNNMNAALYNMEKSIELIKEIFNEALDSFKKDNQYPTVSDIFDLTIQTAQETKLVRNYNSDSL